MAEKDPYSQVYDLLWDLVSQSPRVTSLVRVGNFIKYNDPSWAMLDKAEVTTSDLPEIMLVVTQLTGGLRPVSNGCSSIMRLEWLLSTGDANATRGILPLMWAIFAALANWPEMSSQLTWNNKTFVKRIDLRDANVGLVDAERNRGIRGFSSIWATEIELWFKTDDVISSSSEV